MRVDTPKASPLLQWYRRSQLRWRLHRLRYRPQLASARREAQHLWDDPDPLVSVLIATYNRRHLLIERAIASVLRQTHTNFEVVVVGDCCTDDTGAALAAIPDPRLRFVNRSIRGPYPQDPLSRWRVAGSAPGNDALRLARGQWIAWLDDDDEYSPTHIQVLLDACRSQRLEFVHGVMDAEVAPGVWRRIGSPTPHEGGVCHGAVMYASYLRFMEFDLDCWRYDEHNDWNLWERLLHLGVRSGFVDDIVGRHFLESKPSESESVAAPREIASVSA